MSSISEVFNISEVFKHDPLHFHSATPLDFDTLKSVPESYKWLLESSNHSLDSNGKNKDVTIN